MAGGHVDLRTGAAQVLPEFDVCIVGAGPAGIALALALAASPLRIGLLEAGGTAPQATPQVDIVGRPYAGALRSAGIGGSSHLWGGHCVPLSAAHLGRRTWVPGGAWPFGLAELLPWYARAHELLQLGRFDYDATAAAAGAGARLMPPLEGFETTVSRYQPIDFAERYGAALRRAPNLSVLLHGRAVELVQDAGGRIDGLVIRTGAGRRLTLRAATYVLAAGGIENARLLLASRSRRAEGVANGTGLVGRNFMEHISYLSGTLVPGRAWDVRGNLSAYAAPLPCDGHSIRFHLAATEALEQRLRIPGYRAELHVAPLLRWAGRHVLRPASPAMRARALREIAARPVAAMRALAGARGAPWCLRLLNFVEQVPNPDSRVMLSERRDAHGEPIAAVDWRLSPADREGIARAQAALAASVARAGIGRLLRELPEEKDELLAGAAGGWHHMGTTRMSAEPGRGVVDPQLRAHDAPNLYIAGSSVFPSGGWANPTLTIVALSLRLAAHIEAQARPVIRVAS